MSGDSYALPPGAPAGLYWWHGQLLAELRHYAPGAANVHALASNVGAPRSDVARWVDELAAAGLVDDAEPEFDYPARWVRLSEGGAQWEPQP